MPVEVTPDTCRIDMSVTNLKERGSVKPGFKVQIISKGEWSEIPPEIRFKAAMNPPYVPSDLLAYGRMEKTFFDALPPGQTAARTLTTVKMPCSDLGLYAFWMACHISPGGKFAQKYAEFGCEALLTPTGMPYFDKGLWEGIGEAFPDMGLVECARSDPACSGPVDAERIPLGHLESLTAVAEPEADEPEQDTRTRIDVCIERTLVDEQTCELKMLVTNMTKGLTFSPVLEVEVGLLPDYFPDKPQSWTFNARLEPIEPYYSAERVVGIIDVPCWGLDTLTFRQVCHQDGEVCKNLQRLPGTPFLDQASDEYLSISLRNTPMYRRP